MLWFVALLGLQCPAGSGSASLLVKFCRPPAPFLKLGYSVYLGGWQAKLGNKHSTSSCTVFLYLIKMEKNAGILCNTCKMYMYFKDNMKS